MVLPLEVRNHHRPITLDLILPEDPSLKILKLPAPNSPIQELWIRIFVASSPNQRNVVPLPVEVSKLLYLSCYENDGQNSSSPRSPLPPPHAASGPRLHRNPLKHQQLEAMAPNVEVAPNVHSLRRPVVSAFMDDRICVLKSSGFYDCLIKRPLSFVRFKFPASFTNWGWKVGDVDSMHVFCLLYHLMSLWEHLWVLKKKTCIAKIDFP